jgi:hypothetical protein
MTVVINGDTGFTGPNASNDILANGVTVGKGASAVATNTAVGVSALAANTSGDSNVALGTQALQANTTGYANTATGQLALLTNTTGNLNTATGASALRLNTTGANNSAFGSQALYSNTTASNNTAVGYQAGYSNTASAEGTFVGRMAGYSLNTTGDNYDTFIGSQAGYSVTTGTRNTFVGIGSGYNVTTGSKNSILGAYNGNQGGLDIRTASNYIVLSDGDGNPGFWMTPTNGNAFINAPSTRFTQLSFMNANSQKAALWWDNSLSRFYTYTNTDGPYIANGGTSWTNSSDERLKNITGEIQNGLSKVCSLRAAEYTWKSDESAKPQVGLIAQDVLAVLPEAVEVPPEGAVDRDGNLAMMGVQYNSLIPLLVASIKELKAEVDSLKAQLNNGV